MKKFLFIFFWCLIFGAFIQELRLVVAVPAQVAWTDTGLEVEEGDEFVFEASGKISLQTGNPEAFCGPEGLDLKTFQKPLVEERLGMLLGKVARLISTEIDPQTREVKKIEEVRLFPIGRSNQIKMPISGRLYLGINENIIEDNSGEFLVVIRKRERCPFEKLN